MLVWIMRVFNVSYILTVWLDTRTAETVRKLVENAPRKDKDCLRVCYPFFFDINLHLIEIVWTFFHSEDAKLEIHFLKLLVLRISHGPPKNIYN